MREYRTFLLVLLGAVLTVFGALWENKDKLVEKQKSLDNEITRNKEYVSIIKKSDSMLQKQHDVIHKSNTIIGLQNELKNANQKIITLQNSTMNQITGGSSLPFLKIVIAPMNSYYGQTIFFISNIGKFTIHSTSFDIIDFNDNIKEIISQTGEEGDFSLNSTSKNNVNDLNKLANIGEIPPTFESKIYEGTFPRSIKYLSYTFNLRWLNGYYTGTFLLKKKGKTYEMARISAWDRPNHEIEAKKFFQVQIEPSI